MNNHPAKPSCHHSATAMRAMRIIRPATAAILVLGLASCVRPPPPRTYSPETARHLRNLSHDAPVTPIPSAYGGWGCYGHAPYHGACY